MRKRKLPSKYLRYEQAKNYVSNFGFKTLHEYSQYIKLNGIDYLPLEPRAQYSQNNFKTWEFLGLDESVYKSNLLQLQRELASIARSKRTAESFKKISTTRRKNLAKTNNIVASEIESKVQSESLPSITGLDPDMVISFLMKEDVEPDTIVKMIAELNISSGTLMAELCKYMTKKTLEKQATWRPTGYTTAEAQMTTKI
jgi:hypothetical protein